MIITSNILTLIRGPIALLFLFQNPWIRLTSLFIAVITDSIDGYIARKWRATSRFGAILDPMMDKFFVIFVLGVLIFEQKIALTQAAMMLSRDVALCIFFLYLVLTKRLKTYKIAPAISGKISTALQFCLLIVVTMNYTIPNYIYYFFVFLGCTVLCELFIKLKIHLSNKHQ